MEANKIIIEFSCHHQLASFIGEFEEWREYKAKLERKAFDQRGLHTIHIILLKVLYLKNVTIQFYLKKILL